ncbi:tetratricopeptide repeat protein [Spirochaeta lutea]|uniref:Ancillary SecYEG translocon subunit/Cell division coordinator CpoB TPR domain-containing protein n=1 Tax=Spirochaeta lutea TaxID=1480694 RepID=A0A098R2B3_9SPIO|nr:tetratricopeptide repeat protein [Spirochaeta lutea]KGE73916.1 hypothetical protein DC28_01670 [Spirochaeta lutea]
MPVIENSSKSTLRDKFNGFLARNRRIIIWLSVVFILAVAATIIITEISNNTALEQAAALEKLEDEYAAFMSEDDDAGEAGQEALMAEIDDVKKSFPNTIADQRATMILGELEQKNGNYEAAFEYFTQASTIQEKTYLSVPILIQAYKTAELSGNIDIAVETLESLLDKHGNESVEAPRVLFNLGRLSELKNDPSEANTYYERLLLEYPSSSWTNLAQDRILYLTATGVIID